MRRQLRKQRPVKGGRTFLSSGLIKDLEDEVERMARKFNVSRSFVIATAVADAFGIDEQERYYAIKKPLLLRRVK